MYLVGAVGLAASPATACEAAVVRCKGMSSELIDTRLVLLFSLYLVRVRGVGEEVTAVEGNEGVMCRLPNAPTLSEAVSAVTCVTGIDKNTGTETLVRIYLTTFVGEGPNTCEVGAITGVTAGGLGRVVVLSSFFAGCWVSDWGARVRGTPTGLLFAPLGRGAPEG